MLSTDAVAELLGVRARTVQNLIEGGDLPAYRVGRVSKVRPEDLEACLQANRVEMYCPASGVVHRGGSHSSC